MKNFIIRCSIIALLICGYIQGASGYLYEGDPSNTRYEVEEKFGLKVQTSDNIRRVEVSDDRIRLQNFLDEDRPNDAKLPEDGFVVEILLEECGKRWKKSEFAAWEKVNLKKKTGLGVYVYETEGVESPGFQKAIFFSKKNSKFAAYFEDSGNNKKQMYKILTRIRPNKNICPINGSNQKLPLSTATDEPQNNALEGTEKQIHKFVSASIPSAIVEEKIVVAVNKDFANKYPDWGKSADEVIEYVNSVMTKNTKKRFIIGKYATYDDQRLDNLVADRSEFQLSNSSDSNSMFGGMSIFFWVGENPPDASGGGVDLKNGKVYGTVYIYQDINTTVLRGKDYHIQKNGSDWWEENRDSYFRVPLHEIGHALGLASPDWYNFSYKDYTNDQPLLPDFNLNGIYPFDPMTTGGRTPYEFSDFNAFIINHNLYRALTTQQITSALAKKVIVRVKDTLEQPVPGATVKVYGIKQINIDVLAANPELIPQYYLLRQTVQTDSRGETIIQAPLGILEQFEDGSQFRAEIVKVSKSNPDGELFVGGAWLTLVDLQKTRFLENSNTHYIDIVVQHAN